MTTYQNTLSPRFITYIRDFLLDNEVDYESFLSAIDISILNMEEMSPSIPSNKIAFLFEKISEKLNNPNLAIELASNFHYESSSMIVMACMASKDVSHMLHTLTRFDKFVDSAIFLKMEINRTEVCVSIDVSTENHVCADQINLYLVSFFILFISKATRKPLPVNRLSLALKSIDNIDFDLLGVDSRHISHNKTINKIYFPTEFLSTCLYSSNELLHEVLTNALEHYFSYQSNNSNWIDVVSREILLQFKDGSPTLESIASGMGVSPSTLRRLLSEEEICFKTLKNNAVIQRAKYYLNHTSMSVTEIALELGYSESSAFCRAFKSMENCTPDTFRKTHSYREQY
ncbi:helix-turn-helix transcriptional regulator [Shewanella corallii]|uniref:Helix-turn-helix transcriptional regulator n=1 Tax=Shewanella corallii TaxID=560080 RepID=A0ABT0N485_9GAMM|nr:helix-turn-helix transcriptional regulator [Shewanella corallii]MCL2913263.1 helix-turn-helix transcriptional regulator [Shewanella corallii]